MSQTARKLRRFSPSLDGLERIQLLSAAALPAQMSLIQAGRASQGAVRAAATRYLRGSHTDGFWSADRDDVTIFAVGFEGSFNRTNAVAAYEYGRKLTISKETSLDRTDSAGTMRTTKSNHILLGWYNIDRKEGGWLASTFEKSKTVVIPGYNPPWYRPWEQARPPEIRTTNTLRYLTNSLSSSKTVDTEYSGRWVTRGYGIVLKMAATSSSGNITATFTKPA